MLCPSFAFLVLLGTPLLAQNGWVLRTSAATPPSRGWHGMAYDVGRGVHVLFGGRNSSPVNDTWEWDGANWTQRTPAVSPSARLAHTMAADLGRGNVLLFGGRDAAGLLLADTWTYDGAGWVQRQTAHAPSPRVIAGLAHLGNGGQMILYGGEGASTTQAFGDTWAWDGVDWAPVVTLQSPGPRAAFGFTSDFQRASVVLFGGTTGLLDRADAWSFDGIDWRLLPATQSPSPLANTSLAADLGRGILVQFGGFRSANNLPPTDETWLYDGFDWRRDARATAMTPRRAFGLSYDWGRDCFVLFGGWGLTFSLGETWEYDLRGAATWASLGAGCAGLAIAPELRPVGARAVLGATCSQQVTGGVSGGVVFAVGFSSQSWNGAPLPQSLAGYGMPGCQLLVAAEQTVFRGSVGGAARLDVPIPAVASLAGVELYTQALVFQSGANPFGAVVSNGSRMVVGTF